jgi:hypothetical protein
MFAVEENGTRYEVKADASVFGQSVVIAVLEKARAAVQFCHPITALNHSALVLMELLVGVSGAIKIQSALAYLRFLLRTLCLGTSAVK